MTYSNDFKKHAINIYNKKSINNMSLTQILTLLNISRSTLYEWIKNKNIICSTNTKKAKKAKRHGKIKDNHKRFIIDYVSEHKQFQIKKLLKIFSRKFKMTICKQSVYNVLKEHSITNKKISENHYPHNNDIKKESFLNTLKQIDNVNNSSNNDLVFVDEFGYKLHTMSKYGWSKKGHKCEVNGKMHSKNISVIMSISKNKCFSFIAKYKSIKAVNFNKYIKKIHSPSNKYFMDNASIHKAKVIDETLKNNFIYNCPYYSKFNPIEMFFNTLKCHLNKKYITSLSQLKYHINNFIKCAPIDSYKKYVDKSYSLLVEEINLIKNN